jgi:cellulose synthase/poly-beta-1,6-N-acetylglucosamine synthase-like glycosyltransferase
MNKPKVSVIIPAYNAMSYLPEAVESVLRQTFKDFELIIVDDGSSDRTVEWASSLTDPRVKFISQDNHGSARARNQGIAIAEGDYIALLDADDIWESTKLEKQVNFLDRDPSIGLVDTSVVLIDENGKSTGRVVTSKADADVWKHLVQFQPVCSCDSTPLIRRECLETVGLFDEDLLFLEDLDLWIRLASLYKFGAIEEPLVRYRQYSGSKSTNCQENLLAFRQIIEKTFESAPIELLYLRDRGYGRINLYLAWKSLVNKDRVKRSYHGTQYGETALSMATQVRHPRLVNSPSVPPEGNRAIHFRQQAIAHYPQLKYSWDYLRLSIALWLMQNFGTQTYEKLKAIAQNTKSFISFREGRRLIYR